MSRAVSGSHRTSTTRRLFANTLLAGAIAAGPASALVIAFLAAAGMVHIIKGAPSAADTTTSAAQSVSEIGRRR
jgi:hypothetical protein